MSDNDIPNTPDYTATFGAHLSHATDLRRRRSTATAKWSSTAPSSTTTRTWPEQDAYSLANFRAGIEGRYLFAEGWIRNAFDTTYIPVAFAFPLAQSGFLGESRPAADLRSSPRGVRF